MASSTNCWSPKSRGLRSSSPAHPAPLQPSLVLRSSSEPRSSEPLARMWFHQPRGVFIPSSASTQILHRRRAGSSRSSRRRRSIGHTQARATATLPVSSRRLIIVGPPRVLLSGTSVTMDFPNSPLTSGVARPAPELLALSSASRLYATFIVEIVRSHSAVRHGQSEAASALASATATACARRHPAASA